MYGPKGEGGKRCLLGGKKGKNRFRSVGKRLLQGKERSTKKREEYYYFMEKKSLPSLGKKEGKGGFHDFIGRKKKKKKGGGYFTSVYGEREHNHRE